MAVPKILIHISDRDKWASVLSQIDQMLDTNGGTSPELTVIADVFAGGVCVACSPHLRQQMADSVQKGCRILVCEGSLRLLNLKPENLPDFAQTIPTGIKEIVRLQDEGFHYVKV